MNNCNCETCITTNRKSYEAELIEQEKHNERIGLIFTIISTVLGFVFWPVMVNWLSGHDLFDLMADSVWLSIVWFTVMTVTGAVAGIVALLYSKDR